MALKRSLRKAFGEAAPPLVVSFAAEEAWISLKGRPGKTAPLHWAAPLPQWLIDRINAFDRRGEPLTGVRCALTFAIEASDG